MKPKFLKLEVTNRCNGACVFCPHDGHGEDMGLDMFKKIVDSFEGEEVQPQFFGEPTLHPDFPEMLRYLKAKGKKVTFYTNGSFPLGNVDDVIKADPDRVIFSIESDNAELCRKIRGLDFENIYNNILKFPVSKIRIRMTECVENENRIEEIEDFWKSHGIKTIVVNETPIVRHEVKEFTDYVCKRPFEQLVIKSNGDIVLCCVDWYGEYKIGNIEDGIDKVWNSKKFNDLRKKINAKDEPSICKKCGFKVRG